MVKVTYKHWQTGVHLEVIGTMPEAFNNEANDRIVVKRLDGTFEDVIKTTIIRVEEWNPREYI